MRTHIVLSNTLSTPLDRLKLPYHFVNTLAKPLELEEQIIIKSPNSVGRTMVQSPYLIKLEGLSIEPWPTRTFMVCCSLCPQAFVGNDFKKIISVGSSFPNEFSQPEVEPGCGGRIKEIEISLQPMKGGNYEIFNNTLSVTTQISIVQVI